MAIDKYMSLRLTSKLPCHLGIPCVTFYHLRPKFFAKYDATPLLTQQAISTNMDSIIDIKYIRYSL